MITFGLMSKLMARESSLVTESFNPGKVMGLMPRLTRSMASSSKHSEIFLLNTWVASTARGLSTYTSKPSWPVIRSSSLIFRIK